MNYRKGSRSIQDKPLENKRIYIHFDSFMMTGHLLVPCHTLLYNRGMKSAVVLLLMTALLWVLAVGTPQAQGRTSSGPVGASMAMLATLQDAAVLPPEGTPEANRVIQAVIQFQAVFMKSSDSAVQDFLERALVAQWADRAQNLGARFRAGGWTTEVLEAISNQYEKLPAQELARMAGTFAQFNMRPADFELLALLFGKAQAKFAQRGQDIHQVFAGHRRTMPGGQRGDRKERQNGDQGLYPHQS
jgi:hypothetical protein